MLSYNAVICQILNVSETFVRKLKMHTVRYLNQIGSNKRFKSLKKILICSMVGGFTLYYPIFCIRYDPISNEIQFDHHPRNFPDILALYQNGKLHVSDQSCLISFVEEMEYWQIDERYMEICCHQVGKDLVSSVEKTRCNL